MRIAIMGTGGVGGYFGGLLAHANNDVTFIARGEHLKAMQTTGLRVTSIHGDFYLEKVQATADPGTVGEVDLILLATKTYQIEAAAEAMRPMVGANTAILPLQNGVDSSERLIDIFGPAAVLGGTCQIVSLATAPGQIDQKSDFRRITLGELDGTPSDRAQAIGTLLEESGMQVTVTDNINKARWTKFLFIASFSGVGAAARVPAGEMMACPETRRTLEMAMQEVKTLAAALQVTLDHDIVETTMAFCDNLPPGTTASMQRDIMEGRPSELESQNGYIARVGAERGVAVPVHTFLYSVLLPQEKRTHSA